MKSMFNYVYSIERVFMAEGKDTPHFYQAPLYTPAGFYMLRAPILSADVFFRITASATEGTGRNGEDLDVKLAEASQQSYDTLKALVSRPAIEQALLVASSDIFEGLAAMQREDTSRHRIERAYASVMRYLVRMSTRPTPFGLFAGVAVGTLGENTTAQLGIPIVQRIRTRPDMSWLLSIIQKIEENTDLVPHLHVIANRTVYIAGSRAVIPYADVYGKGDTRSIALRATPVVRFVLEHASQLISYNDLRQGIFGAFPHATEPQVDGLLRQLWEHHFLMSDLRPPLTNADPAKYVLERLSHIPEAALIATTLKEVLVNAEEIDQVGVGESNKLMRDMVKRQAQLVPEDENKSQPYQLDVALKLETPQLNKAIGETASEAAETLLRLGRFPAGSQSLREYYSAFVERYGMETEVPVLDLLSPEFGLEAPSGYTEPPRSYPLRPLSPPDMQARDRILCSMLAEALNDRAMEIELTASAVQKLTQWTPKADNPPPPSLEMYLQIQAASPEAIDRGEWRGVIAPACLSYGGRTFCRFFDILGPEGLEKLQEYTRREEDLFPDVIFAELSYLPTFGRGANVAIRPALRAYEIVVNTTPSVPPERVIPLNDLMVGTRGEHFYLRSLRLGKEVVVTQSHLLNMMRAPNVCRFLLEASQDGRPSLSSFDWGTAGSSPFLPRVVQKQIVLSPAQWNLQPSMIEPDGFGSEGVCWFMGLQKWRKRWRVPRYVYLTQFDNRLLLDLEHPLSVAELRAELRKAEESNSLSLQEMVPDFDHLWLRDSNNAPYIAEVVVPLILKESEAQQGTTPETKEEHEKQGTKLSYPQKVITDTERRKLPGDEWTYLKLYATAKQHDEIITKPLREIVREMNEQKLIDRWFYIRYADPEPHLRVRFHAADVRYNDTVLLQALAWSRELVKYGLIRHVCVDSYDREIERYGGPKAIDALEMVFTANSSAVSAIVAAQYMKEITLDPLAVAVFSLDQFFTAWGLDFAERLCYIQKRIGKYDGSEAFRTQRRLFCELLSPWDPNYDPVVREQREKLGIVLSVQDHMLKEVASHIRGLGARAELWRPEESIVGSLAHMHINRLLGIDREQEQRVYAFWRHTLESIQRRPAKRGMINRAPTENTSNP